MGMCAALESGDDGEIHLETGKGYRGAKHAMMTRTHDVGRGIEHDHRRIHERGAKKKNEVKKDMAQAMHVRTPHGIISNAEPGVTARKPSAEGNGCVWCDGLCDGGPCAEKHLKVQLTPRKRHPSDVRHHRPHTYSAREHNTSQTQILLSFGTGHGIEEIAHRPWRQCRATQDTSWFPKYTAGMYSLGGIGERVSEECAERENRLLVYSA
jgi:hypothetical protein